MKQKLKDFIHAALRELHDQGALPLAQPSAGIQLERTRDRQHGDFSSNIALVLAKEVGKKPRELAEQILQHLPSSEWVQAVEIAGPGFINFRLTPAANQAVIEEILTQKEAYGKSTLGAGQTIHIEFVSSNPTGPLHVGHGRGAAYGATLADLLAAAGYKVHREYYVNDAGRQMDILATSVWLRYLECCGETIAFPSNGYQGGYVRTIAQQLLATDTDAYCHPPTTVFERVPLDEPQGGDKEAHIDGLIANAKRLLGSAAYQRIFDLTLKTILADIRDDLAAFGVEYQQWFSERSLYDEGYVKRALTQLEEAGLLYEQEGATWFRSTAFGDDKDRVVIRENGQTTYFASDIAYFFNKHERGFSKSIIVTGADHHGYIPRLKAAQQALGLDAKEFIMTLVQFAVLYRGKERVPMSTRSGSYVTLRELREEVGTDAARFFYVWRKSEQHLDFDLELAKSQSNDNPVYYIQYAHARICSVFRQVTEKGIRWDKDHGLAKGACLIEPHEQGLLTALSRYPEVVETAAINLEPHLIAHFLRELANSFHGYYNAHQFLIEDAAVRDARLALCAATRQVLNNGLTLLGVSAPEAM